MLENMVFFKKVLNMEINYRDFSLKINSTENAA